MKILLIVLAFCALSEESFSLAVHRSRRGADTCGVLNNDSGLIVRGKTFPRGTYPWIVALMHTGYSPPKYFCGGTLISATFVVSGSNCGITFLVPKYSTFSRPLHSPKARGKGFFTARHSRTFRCSRLDHKRSKKHQAVTQKNFHPR